MRFLVFALLDWLFGEVEGPEGGGRSRSGTVPDVRGLDADDALFALLSEGFKAEIDRLEDDPAPVMGIVVSQVPDPGTRWRRADRVRLGILHPSRDQDVTMDDR